MNETLKNYRLQTGLSKRQLALRADIDEATLRRAEAGKKIQDVKAQAIANTLSDLLKIPLTIEALEIKTV